MYQILIEYALYLDWYKMVLSAIKGNYRIQETNFWEVEIKQIIEIISYKTETVLANNPWKRNCETFSFLSLQSKVSQLICRSEDTPD